MALGALLVCSLLGGAGAAAARQADGQPSTTVLQWSFDGDPPGAVPDGVEVFDGAWAVQVDPTAPSPPNVLCQTATAVFPALALADQRFGDLRMTAQVKPISGREDRAAGLIFRIQDRDNYYILRANALENNVNFYKYTGGRRTLMSGSRVDVASGQWQELRLEATGNTFRGFLNSQLVVEASDDSYADSRVGLWTKSDSLTCFDDVEVEPLS